MKPPLHVLPTKTATTATPTPTCLQILLPQALTTSLNSLCLYMPKELEHLELIEQYLKTFKNNTLTIGMWHSEKHVYILWYALIGITTSSMYQVSTLTMHSRPKSGAQISLFSVSVVALHHTSSGPFHLVRWTLSDWQIIVRWNNCLFHGRKYRNQLKNITLDSR